MGIDQSFRVIGEAGRLTAGRNHAIPDSESAKQVSSPGASVYIQAHSVDVA